MARMTNSQLQSELERLRAENAVLAVEAAEVGARQRAENDRLAEENEALRLQTERARTEAELARSEADAAILSAEQARAEADEARSQAATLPIEPLAPAAPASARRRSRWWTVLSAFLIIVGLILAPVAAVGSWVRVELTDTDAFVATFAPLADDPAVQEFVADQVVAAINDQIDIPGITNQVFDGIEDLGLGPAATQALNLLREPAVSGIQSLIDRVATQFVQSDAFSSIWSQALRVSHTQLIAAIQGDQNAAIDIGSKGEIGVQLGPIIDAVKVALVKNGIAFAASIPTIDKTIVIAQSDSVVLVQTLYGVAVATGTWLPWVALAFLVVGVLVARRRVGALLGTSIGLGLVMIALASGVAIGSIVFIGLVSPTYIPADAAGDIYAQLTAYVSSAAGAVAVLAITVAVVTWLAGPFRTPRALRGIFAGWIASLRGVADAHGVTTGRFGRWLYAQRVVVRVVVAIAAAAIVLFVRPLTPALIIWTAVIALVLLGVSELLQRPDAEAVEPAPEDTPAAVG